MERWRDMNKKLKLKIHESLSAVIPITLIVLALGMTVVPMELSTLMRSWPGLRCSFWAWAFSRWVRTWP